MFKIIILLLISITAQANICLQLTDDVPVLAGGRVKPYFVLAKESLKHLTGKPTYQKQSATSVFCQIMFQKRLHKVFDLPIKVEHLKTKKLLQLSDQTSHALASSLMSKMQIIRAEIFKQKENNSYKKDLTKLFNRISTYEQILQQKALSVYTEQNGTEMDNAWETIAMHSSLNDDKLSQLIKHSKEKYIKSHNDKYLIELTYVKSNIFSYAMLIALIGIFLVVLLKNLKWGVLLAIITILIETVGMAMRIYISGRAPITNMYETVLFSGYGALIIALIIVFFKRDKIFILAGLSYNILCLFMMMFANNMLNSSISPLVPVLRDNFWLSTHVTTIMLSYAALALSWIVANITLVKLQLKKLTKKDYRYHQELIYTCIKVGIVLLATGIILGGVWADYSWGRFWGWDPKETWSLIVLLFYMVLVHGRYSSWITTHRFVVLSAAGFMTVMMAWFGVNYILASGLHSYGFSEGGAIFLGSFFVTQIIILIVLGNKVNFQGVND
jgi:cytochrome c-type biogenesis protein CcsB